MLPWRTLKDRARRRRGRHGRAGGEDSPYLSPKEIALRNAADSLGVTLGEYYPDDVKLPDGFEGRDRHPELVRQDASREELLTYAAGRQAKRRRRRARRLRAGAFSLVGVLTAVIGLDALVDMGSSPTGWHDTERRETVRDRWRPQTRPSSIGRGVPSLNQSGASTEFANGRRKVVGSAYIDQTGSVCSKIAQVADGVTQAYSAGGCLPQDQIARMLAQTPAVIVGFEVGRQWILLNGFARRDVRGMRVRRPAGRGRVAISGPWVPASPGEGGTAVKTFLVKVPFRSGRQLTEGLRAPTQPGLLEFAAVLDDGHVSRARGMWETDNPRCTSPCRSDRLYALASRK